MCRFSWIHHEVDGNPSASRGRGQLQRHGPPRAPDRRVLHVRLRQANSRSCHRHPGAAALRALFVCERESVS